MDKGNRNIEETIEWFNSFSGLVIDAYSSLMEFVREFHSQMIESKKKLPYNINIIDELHINENGHSRILYKLLLYETDVGRYDILNSLLCYIKDTYPHKKAFRRIKLNNPQITQEKERIDLWVRDNSFAIIFENKIYNAVDQDAQIHRYIEKTKAQKYGYKDSEIYVIYLSQSGQEPDDYSWGKYKNSYKPRYLNLSFRKDILPWLRGYVLPAIRYKDIYLLSAVIQYIDYLEGIFYLRTSNKDLLMDLTKLLKKDLGIEESKDPAEIYHVIQNKLNDIYDVTNALESIKNNYRQAIYNEWKEKTRSLYPDLRPCLYNTYTDVSFSFEEGKDIVVSLNTEKGYPLYCQVEFKGEKVDADSAERRVVDTPLIMNLRDLLPEPKHDVTTCIWQDLRPDDFDGAFSLFCQVVNRIKNSVLR